MPSDDCLKKLYIEPTARCNLRCKMCFRNSWKNEIIGDMRMETFRKAMTTMPDSVETVFFGGMGEPLAHPDIVEMVRTASALGKRVELLSNGTLLDARRTAELLDAGLDMLWLSIDALDDGRYAQIAATASWRWSRNISWSSTAAAPVWTGPCAWAWPSWS